MPEVKVEHGVKIIRPSAHCRITATLHPPPVPGLTIWGRMGDYFLAMVGTNLRQVMGGFRMEEEKQNIKAYWVLMQREMGCDTCRKWNRDPHGVPCEGYDAKNTDMEEECRGRMST